jgi:dephospho-CoA kinase
MILIGLTGGISTGKSTVSRLFSEDFGVPVVDADLISRQSSFKKTIEFCAIRFEIRLFQVVEPKKSGYQHIKRLFGETVFEPDGSLNRDKLGRLIFSDEKSRKILNKALHKLIAFEMLKQILWHLIKGHRYVIVDAPLLFEVKMFLKYFKYKIVVFCDESQQLDRLLKRNTQLSETEAKQRIQSQLATADKIKMADFTIDNTKDLSFTREQVEKLHETFENSKAYLTIRMSLIGLLSLLGFLLGSIIKKILF